MKNNHEQTAPEPAGIGVELRKDFFRYGPAKIVPPLVSVAAVVIILRILSPEQVGRYVIVHSSAIMAAAVISSLWGNAAIRFLPKDKADWGQLFGTVFALSSAVSLAVLAIGWGFLAYGAQLFPAATSSLIFAGFVLAALYFLHEILLYFLNAQRRSSLYTIFMVTKILLGPIIGISAALLISREAQTLIWGYVAATGGTLVPLVLVSMPAKTRLSDISLALAKKITVFGVPLLASSLFVWLLGISDRYIIGIFRGAEEVAIYSVAYSLSEQPFNLISGLVILTGWPLVVQAWEHKSGSFALDILSRMVRLYLLFALPTVAALWLLSKPLIELFATSAYQAGFMVIPFVASGAFLLGIQKLVSNGPLLHKVTHLSLLTTLAATIFNVLLNLLLVPKYGYLAAAVVTFLSYVFFLIITPLVMRKYMVWAFPAKSFLRIGLATAAAVLAASATRTMLEEQAHLLVIITLLGVGGIAYVGTLRLLKEIGPIMDVIRRP